MSPPANILLPCRDCNPFSAIIVPGSTFSIMNIFLLMIAAPFTITFKLTNGGRPPFSEGEVNHYLGIADSTLFPTSLADTSAPAVRGRRELVPSEATVNILVKVQNILSAIGSTAMMLILMLENIFTIPALGKYFAKLARSRGSNKWNFLGEENRDTQVYERLADIGYLVAHMLFAPVSAVTFRWSHDDAVLSALKWVHWIVQATPYAMQIYADRHAIKKGSSAAGVLCLAAAAGITAVTSEMQVKRQHSVDQLKFSLTLNSMMLIGDLKVSSRVFCV